MSRALNYRSQRKSYRPLSQTRRNGIIGDSPPMSACLELVSAAAGSSASILLRGETGTGKELFAKTIHLNSPRGSGPFVVVDCASLPEHLAESVLFGHIRGAFTGADRNHVGLVAQADGGTLFLDELGELPFSLQKTLLRVLQERKYRPVGSSVESPSDFRLVAATNRDIDQMVAEGVFRKDLLYRLRSFVIYLPPLRDRGSDIELLAHHFMSGIAGRNRQAVPETSPEFLECLRDYPWPGNVRELANALEWAMLEARGAEVLEVSFLPREIREHQARMRFRSPEASPVRSSADLPEPEFAVGSAQRTWKDFKDEVVGRAARSYFEDLLENTRGDMSRASELCGMSRPNLYAMLRRYGISTRRW